MTLNLDRPDEGEMLAMAASAAEQARRCGADFADVAITWSRHISVELEANDVQLCEQHETWHFSVRAFVGGGMGLAGGDGPPQDLHGTLVRAIELARLAGRDPDFADLPRPNGPLIDARLLDLYDPLVAEMCLPDAARLGRHCIDQARAIDGGILLSGDLTFSASRRAMAGSTGVRMQRAATYAEVDLFAVARDGDDIGSFSDQTVSRHMADLRVAPLAGRVVRLAREYQHARPCRSGTQTLVLAPLASGSLLGSLAAATSAERLRRGRSPLARLRGQAVVSPLLTLADRPLSPRGIYTSSCDSDGSPRRDVEMIQSGVFAEPLNNHYHARLWGEPNNGHGTRQGEISPTNLQVAPGSQTEAELIADVGEGIYLQAGSLDPDPASGDFSSALDFARRIEKGRLTWPINDAMAAGNLLEVLSRVDGVSSDYRSDPGLILPAIRIRDVQISGTQ
ncbi:MAG: Metalloprotease PmbA [Phycisphaerae bacterium]|nr:Metalloprotease PmbA [Phycisphaerae bacterium]